MKTAACCACWCCSGPAASRYQQQNGCADLHCVKALCCPRLLRPDRISARPACRFRRVLTHACASQSEKSVACKYAVARITTQGWPPRPWRPDFPAESAAHEMRHVHFLLKGRPVLTVVTAKNSGSIQNRDVLILMPETGNGQINPHVAICWQWAEIRIRDRLPVWNV